MFVFHGRTSGSIPSPGQGLALLYSKSHLPLQTFTSWLRAGGGNAFRADCSWLSLDLRFLPHVFSDPDIGKGKETRLSLMPSGAPTRQWLLHFSHPQNYLL